MLAGSPPFKSPSEYLTFQKILEGVVEVPDEASADARDLILGLLTLDPVKRLGRRPDGAAAAHTDGILVWGCPLLSETSSLAA